jgi:hypothetical protein
MREPEIFESRPMVRRRDEHLLEKRHCFIHTIRHQSCRSEHPKRIGVLGRTPQDLGTERGCRIDLAVLQALKCLLKFAQYG